LIKSRNIFSALYQETIIFFFFRLTAFVAKSFQQAMPYITIEENIIKEALHWLSTNQAANGSFSEMGKVIHQDMQGGSAKGLALTAYTLIAFLENQVCKEIQSQRLWFNIILLSNALA
jgi:hypothetical protein